jgi:hypothetical protein
MKYFFIQNTCLLWFISLFEKTMKNNDVLVCVVYWTKKIHNIIYNENNFV